jgi:hypothetical protein
MKQIIIWFVTTLLVSGCQSLSKPTLLKPSSPPRDYAEKHLYTTSSYHPTSQLALVIGNSNYRHNPLRNPVNDAKNMARVLRRIGFDVTLKTNLTTRAMNKAAYDFSERLSRTKSVGFFYFSGHGASHEGNNYLIPINGDIRVDFELKFEAFNAERVVEGMARANKNGINIIILDASRDNPYPKSTSFTRGLAQMSLRKNTIIAFSHSPHRTADEVTNLGYGLYTKHLSRALKIAGQKHQRIEDVLMEVRNSVYDATNGMQEPWYQSTLARRKYCFGGCFPPKSSPPPKIYKLSKKANAKKPHCGFWANLFGIGRCGEKYQAAKHDTLASEEAKKKAEAKRLSLKAEAKRRAREAEIQRVHQIEKEKRIHRQNVTTIERYPTIECRDRVPIVQEFSVKVSLTENLITPQVITKPSPKTNEHSSAKVIEENEKKIALFLPDRLKVPTTASNEQDTWEIEVELSAPAFNFRGSDIATITLPLHGDSDIARFRLTPKSIQEQEKTQKIYALLWHQGVYLARIVREVTVTNKSRGNLLQAKTFRYPRTGSTSQPAPPSSTPKLRRGNKKQVFSLDLQSPDMTIYLEHKISRISVHSNELKRLAGSLSKIVGLSKWLDNYYGYFTRASQNIIRLASYGQSTNSEKRRNIARLKGFGRQLYEQFAPSEFKKAFWALKEKLGDEFDTIQIFTDDPLIPWELMIPSRGNEELDFLGIDFQIARWHLSENQELARPSQILNMQKLLAIFPEYPDDNLASVGNELEVLQKITGFRRVSGRYDALSQLFKTAATDNSMIHFSGHGIVQKTRQGLTRYAIKLEDGQLDSTTWRGLISRRHQTHPFFFFNACDIGQAHHVANFVDGWAPAVLEAGASGYIGGLWPLVNQGATKFAEQFYQQLEKSLKAGQPANVADLLRKTRKRFYDNGDPTFLGYVYYGDPHFQLVRE